MKSANIEIERLRHGLKTRVTWEAVFWAVGTSAYFMLVYNGCNWLASRRAHVPSLYFAWERRIPFVAAMIVPYMSMDVFFFLSFFFCTDRREMRLHGLRLLAAMIVAAVCFLIFPLKFAFTRPAVGGFYGFLFTVLGSFDRPYNLVPSLHIALLVLLWAIYRRHSRGWVRLALAVWFILIGISPLLTWQHHLIDIVTGFLLGVAILWLMPQTQGTIVSASTSVPRTTPLPAPLL